jgi:hypothetical protein
VLTFCILADSFGDYANEACGYQRQSPKARSAEFRGRTGVSGALATKRDGWQDCGRKQSASGVDGSVKGVVIPEGAIFSGQVIESAAKSATNPSRLAVRMDSAQWKNKGSGTLVSVELDPRVYLSSWYYPPVLPKEGDHDRPIGIADASHNPTMPSDPSGGGRNQRNPAAPPLPTPDDETLPPRQSADTQNHRVQLKSVQSMRNDDGILVLTSDHSNIKLDKTLTYVLATRDFGGVK